jgi:hypothetical protein
MKGCNIIEFNCGLNDPFAILRSSQVTEWLASQQEEEDDEEEEGDEEPE